MCWARVWPKDSVLVFLVSAFPRWNPPYLINTTVSSSAEIFENIGTFQIYLIYLTYACAVLYLHVFIVFDPHGNWKNDCNSILYISLHIHNTYSTSTYSIYHKPISAMNDVIWRITSGNVLWWASLKIWMRFWKSSRYFEIRILSIWINW